MCYFGCYLGRMTWYDIKWDGQTYVENLSGAAEKTLTGLGIHGYATQAEAEANPQTMNDVQAALGGAQALAGYSGSSTNIPTPGGVAIGAGATASTAANAIPGLSQFFNALTQINTWIRVAKVIIGGTLLIISLAHMTGAENAVASAARKTSLPI
jgi:hypothetical protein